MGVYRRRDTGALFVKFRIRGRDYRRSLPEATSKAQGKVVETQMRQEIFEGRYGRTTGEMLFSEFIDKHYKKYREDNFKDYRSTLYSLEMFKREFEGKSLGEITPLTIDAWKQKRLRTPTIRKALPHPATVQNEMALLSSVFEAACDDDLLSKNPMRKVRRFKQSEIICKRQRVLSDEEERKLRAALAEGKREVLWAFLIAINTGMRKSEILNLKWEDINLEHETISVSETKTGWPRVLPISEELMRVFAEMMPSTGKLFRISYQSLLGGKHAFGSALRRAGITGFRFHDIRHTFNSRLPSDAIVRAAWLGHTRVDTNLIYSHVSLGEMRRAIQPKTADFERNIPPVVRRERRTTKNRRKFRK